MSEGRGRGSDKSVVIVGGGITGLSAAYYVHSKRPNLALRLLERRDRVGGNIVTERRDGFLIDAGPDSFVRTKPDALELCEELGLSDELITTRPEAQHVFMVHEGRLERLPAGMALAVPTRIGPMLRTPLLSLSGKLRILADLALPAKTDDGDESIASFLSRRFGHEAANRIAGPLLGGIYAGDVKSLSIHSTFPQLSELEARHGSLLFGFFAAQNGRKPRPSALGRAKSLAEMIEWLRRDATVAKSPFMSLKSGMGSLVDTLRARLPDDAVVSNCAVRALERDGSRWRIVAESGEQYWADAVVLAAPAHIAARIVPPGRLAHELSEIPYVSTATVFFAFRRSDVQRSLEGAGFIVPPGEARILAGTWVSSKWELRAPEGAVLVRAFVGGARQSIEFQKLTDDALAGEVKEELVRLMGPLGEPLFTRVFRYDDSNPQPVVGHGARLARIAAELRALPGLYVAGAAYDGVGIPDCVRQGKNVAERLLRERC